MNSKKHSIPVYQGDTLNRNAISQLCRGIQYKIIYVLADIGWGKTTAFVNLAKAVEDSVYWITLCEEENHWEKLKVVLEEGILFSYSFLKDRCILVLDDFYKITDTEALENLGNFIKNVPDNIQFFILGRQIPPEFLSDFIVKRQLFLITNESLRLDKEETKEYFNLLGYEISIEDAEELRAISDGWPIFLNCISLEIHQNNGKVLRGNQYLNSRRMLSRTIEKEVLGPLDERLQNCLLLLSFFNAFSLKEAEILTAVEDVQDLLMEFLKGSSFLQITEEDHYRFQQNIDYFMAQIRDKRLSPELLDGACQRIGGYYEGESFYLKALQIYFERNLYSDGIRVLKILLKKHPATEDYYEIEDYLLQLPEALIREDPLLCSGIAMIHAINYRMEESWYWYKNLIALREILPMAQQKKENLEPIIAHANIAIPVIYDDKKLVKQIFNIAKMNLKADSFFYDITVTGNQPRILAGSRDFSNWTQHIPPLKRILLKPIEILLGPKAGAVIDTGIAETYYQYNQLSSSMIEVSKAIAKSRKTRAMDILFVNRGISAQIYHAQGQMREARKVIHQFKIDLVKNNAEALFDNAHAFSALQDLIDGNNEKALEWALNHTPDESCGFRVLDRYLYLIKTRVYLCNGFLNKALPLIEILQNYSMDYFRNYNLIETTILKAICLDKMGEEELAEETMLTAIELARNYRFIRVFADEGLGCSRILERLKKNNEMKKDKFYEEIQVATYAFSQLHPGYYRVQEMMNTTLLTRAEKNVLGQISTGKTNAEIARTLNISMATVKTHINHVYSKLEVSNRTQALIKARGEGII